MNADWDDHLIYSNLEESLRTGRQRLFRRAHDDRPQEGNCSPRSANYLSLGQSHSNRLPHASFNKSAAKQCRLIRQSRNSSAVSLPDLFNSYMDEVNGLQSWKAPLDKNSAMASSTDSLQSFTLTPSKQSSSSSLRDRLLSSNRQTYFPYRAVAGHTEFTTSLPCRIMRRVSEKAATVSSGKPKKKRASFFSFFYKKKRAGSDHPELDDCTSHGGSMLAFDDDKSDKTTSSSPPMMPPLSKKSFPAPAPPGTTRQQRSPGSGGGVTKFTRQNSVRRMSGRRYSSRKKSPAKPIHNKSSVSEKTTTTIIIDSSLRSNLPPLPKEKPPSPPKQEKKRASPSSSLTTATAIQTEEPTSAAESPKVSNGPRLLETHFSTDPVMTYNEVGIDVGDESSLNDSISGGGVANNTSIVKIPSSPTLRKHQPELALPPPPAVPLSQPPPPETVAVVTNFFFASNYKQSASPVVVSKQQSHQFELAGPVRVDTKQPSSTSFDDEVADLNSETSSSSVMLPSSDDLKRRLKLEHQNLLSLFDDWEYARRSQKSGTITPETDDINRTVTFKQQALLKKYNEVNNLYQQLLSPAISVSSSPVSGFKLNNHSNSDQYSTSIVSEKNHRTSVPVSTPTRNSHVEVINENNNIKQEPERNIKLGLIDGVPPNLGYTRFGSENNRPRLSDNRSHAAYNNGHYGDHLRFADTRPKPQAIVHNVPITYNDWEPQQTNGYTVTSVVSSPTFNSSELKVRQSPQKSEYANSYVATKNHQQKTRAPPSFTNSNGSIHSSVISENGNNNSNGNNNGKFIISSESVKKPLSDPLAAVREWQASQPVRALPASVLPVQPSPNFTRPTLVKQRPQPIQETKRLHPTSTPAVVSKQPPPSFKQATSQNTPPRIPKPSPSNETATSPVTSFPQVTLKKVPKPVEKSFNLGRVLPDNEAPRSQPASTSVLASPAGPPPPPPPPPPASMLRSAPSVPSSAGDDALRNDMLAEIRQAGGVRFLRSKQRAS